MSFIPLPPPRKRGELSLEEALALRRSIRRFLDKPLTLAQLAQLLWASQGPVDKRRTVPSAGALYPLEAYAVVGNVEGLEPGVYHYVVPDHSLELVKRGDVRRELARACLDQYFIAEAPVSIVIGAVYERTTRYYGVRGRRYVLIEVGHSGQNVYLQATAMGLGTVAVGAFIDELVSKILGLPGDVKPLYVMPVGYHPY